MLEKLEVLLKEHGIKKKDFTLKCIDKRRYSVGATYSYYSVTYKDFTYTKFDPILNGLTTYDKNVMIYITLVEFLKGVK